MCVATRSSVNSRIPFINNSLYSNVQLLLFTTSLQVLSILFKNVFVNFLLDETRVSRRLELNPVILTRLEIVEEFRQA